MDSFVMSTEILVYMRFKRVQIHKTV